MHKPSKTVTTGKEEINIKTPTELNYWADKFGITNAKLRAAVNAAGPSVKAVDAYLRKR
jgi:hypothetical protein